MNGEIIRSIYLQLALAVKECDNWSARRKLRRRESVCVCVEELLFLGIDKTIVIEERYMRA